jgi:hypothetical protein
MMDGQSGNGEEPAAMQDASRYEKSVVRRSAGYLGEDL